MSIHTSPPPLAQLRTLRATLLYNPSLIISLALKVLQHPTRLGDELWDIYEQLTIAYLDMGDMDSAEVYLDLLVDKFTKSSFRVKKLLARKAEGKGEFDQAMNLYTQLTDERASDLSLYKRKISLLKSQGNTEKAISTLVTFMDTFPLDMEGWIELSNLYVSENMFQHALFAMEEACLIMPNNHFVHESIANIYVALNAYELALKSLCRCIEIVPSYVPGLFAIVQCCLILLENKEDHDWRILLKTTRDALLGLYAKTVVPSIDDSMTLQATQAFLHSI